MKGKTLLPVILMVLFAISRWPGLMPQNFSAVYAMMFCAGVFFPRRMAWWLPLGTVLISDICLNVYWHNRVGSPLFSPELISNYAAYIVLIGLGRWFGPKTSFVGLLGGGILGAILFYVITNTFSWVFNPEYARTFMGWLKALTQGTPGWPSTLEFFRNTLGSGGLFTALFAGAMKLLEAPEPAGAREKEEEPETELEPEAEEAKV